MPVEISVVVPSHDRPLRLRWLLNALEHQSLDPARWELIVAHDSRGEETERLLQEHPLGDRVTVRSLQFAPGSAAAGAKRNAGWRAANGPLVMFTDDDCMPPPSWLERALIAAARHPGAIVQGATGPEPQETMVVAKHAPYAHTISIGPPQPWAQTCNIIYPRSVLDATGGFPEDVQVAEDTLLAEAARALGTEYVGAKDVVTYHAVEEITLRQFLRGGLRWVDMPVAIARAPRLREEMIMWVFWKRSHFWLVVALAGVALMRRNRAATLLIAPYLIHTVPSRHGASPRGRVRSLVETPPIVALHLIEIAGLAYGSIKHRKLLL